MALVAHASPLPLPHLPRPSAPFFPLRYRLIMCLTVSSSHRRRSVRVMRKLGGMCYKHLTQAGQLAYILVDTAPKEWISGGAVRLSMIRASSTRPECCVSCTEAKLQLALRRLSNRRCGQRTIMGKCDTTKTFFPALPVSHVTPILPHILQLTRTRGPAMEMAALLCVLSYHDLQPLVIQPWCLPCIHWPPLVARYGRRHYRLFHSDRPRGSEQPWRDKVLHRVSGLCPRRCGGERSELVHSGAGHSCSNLLCNTDVLRRAHHNCLHARHVRQWI